jgi:hypothetical protein
MTAKAFGLCTRGVTEYSDNLENRISIRMPPTLSKNAAKPLGSDPDQPSG